MKPMSERKTDLRKGKPMSEGFFPEEAEVKAMKRPGEVKGFKYPDTEELVHRDQEQFVHEATRAEPKTGYRH